MIKIEEVFLNPSNIVVGGKVNVSVRVIDVSWDNVKTMNRDWKEINSKYINWFSVRVDKK